MKKILPYLLLNVFVSAATVLIVLLIWNAAHPALSPVTGSTVGTGELQLAVNPPTATLPPLDKVLLEVQSVIGSGDIQNEHLHVLYLGSDPLDIQNWTLQEGRKKVYTFPAFVLFKGGAFDLYTMAGTNSAIELYMGMSDSIWSSGNQLSLHDPAGNVRLTYKIP